MLTEALSSLIKDPRRVSFITCLFIIMGCFTLQNHSIAGDFEKYSELRAENHFGQQSAQLKTEKKEFFILEFKVIDLAPTLLEIPILFIAFFLGVKTRRGYFKSCLSPPIGDN